MYVCMCAVVCIETNLFVSLISIGEIESGVCFAVFLSKKVDYVLEWSTNQKIIYLIQQTWVYFLLKSAPLWQHQQFLQRYNKFSISLPLKISKKSQVTILSKFNCPNKNIKKTLGLIHRNTNTSPKNTHTCILDFVCLKSKRTFISKSNMYLIHGNRNQNSTPTFCLSNKTPFWNL